MIGVEFIHSLLELLATGFPERACGLQQVVAKLRRHLRRILVR
jgi:hypothetical protein